MRQQCEKGLTITNGTGFISVKLDNFGSFGTNFNLFVELKEKGQTCKEEHEKKDKNLIKETP